jgi:TolB-like protein/tetratricopeptide (TPR) repeat protein
VKLAFENQVLDLDRRELTRAGETIVMEPQVFDLLVYLVENRHRLVTRDDLIAGVWNGRIVSDSTLASRITSARQAINDNGEAQRLVRTIVRKGYRFVGEVTVDDSTTAAQPEAQSGQQPEATSAQAPLRLPDAPSIAVLPFQNLSDDPQQEYFADGMVEEITTSLSRVGWLFVIARNSSFIYKGQPIDVRRVGRELGVRYVLEGSVRKAADKIRITGQLIDATTGGHLWADRFDGELTDVFELQDQVTARVVGAIAPKVQQAEIERARRKTPEALDAYDLLLRGLANVHQSTHAANSEALLLFIRATEIDPEFASAYGMAAYCYIWRKSSGWMGDQKKEVADAARLARRAVELARDDPVTLARGGQALGYVVGDLDDGAAYIDQALAVCPNLALAWYASGWIRIFLGEPDLGIDHLLRAMRLSPLDPEISRVHAGIATAHLVQGRYREALECAQQALRGQPGYLTAVRLAAASSAMIGKQQASRQWIATLRQIDPALRVSTLGERLPFRRPEHLARYEGGLRKAGLPG